MSATTRGTQPGGFEGIPLDAIPMTACLLDETCTIIGINEAWRRFADENPPVHRNPGLGVNYLDVCTRAVGTGVDDAQTFAAGLRQVRDGREERFIFDYTCHSPVKERWFRATVTRYPTANGMRMLVIHADMTAEHRVSQLRLLEKERSRRLLQGSDTKYRLLFDSMQEGVFYQDHTGRLVDVNDAALGMLGLSRDEFLARTSEHPAWQVLDGDRRILAPEEHPSIRALRSGKAVTDVMLGVVNPRENRVRWLISSAIPVFGEDPLVPVQAFVTLHDVTRRKEAEDVLRYQAMLLDQISDTVTATDLNGTITYVNRAQTQRMGRCREELVGSSVLSYGDDPSVGATQQEIIATTLREGEWRGEVLNKTADGEEIILDARTILIRDAAGQPIGMVGVGTDITLRKRAEDALRRSEERYALVIAGVGSAIWDWDIVNKTVEYSDQWKQMRGYEVEDVGTDEREWRAGIHPDDIERVERALRTHFEGLTPVYHEEYRVRRKDGLWMWISDNGVVRRDASGRVVRMVGSETDISARKRAEALLLQQEATYRAVVESTADGFIITGQDGLIRDVNPAYCHLSGYTREELVGSPIALLEAKESREEILAHIRRVMDTGTDLFETRHRKKDGTVWLVQVSVAFWPIGGGTVFGFFRDVIKRHRSEALLFARMRYSQMSSGASLQELMQAALDDAELFTGSSIGFLHFVDADQESVTLQAWSTNTRMTMCRAEGHGLHYPISKAGVWTDCYHARRPVIHNDVARLPHLKGMPEGHAPVVRELVVPVIREGKVTAVFGVGNKTTDYTDEDVNAVSAIATMVMDIVERDRAEANRRISEERYRLLFELSNEGIFHSDPTTGAILAANRTACAMLGLSEEEICRRGRKGVLDPDDPRGPAAVRARSSQGQVEAELRMVRGDGTKFEASISSALYKLSDGSVRTDVLFRDVSQRRQMELALRKLSAAVEHSPLAVIITDRHGAIEYVNPRFEQVTGYSREEVLGENPRLLQSGLTPRETYVDLWDAVERGEIWHGEFQNRKKDGSLFWEEAWITPIPDPSGEVGHLVGMKEDITSRKEVERTLEQQREALGAFASHLEAAREKERTMIAREVHDAFGQILSAIKLDAMMLAGSDLQDQGYASRKSLSIVELVESGLKTVHEISARLRPGILDNLGLVSALEWLAEDFQQRTGIACEAVLPDGDVHPDPEESTAIFRCAQALMTNVVLHAKARSVMLACAFMEDTISLTVEDDGRGIDPACLDNPRSFGLIGIRERARSLGGTFTIGPGAGGGTLARVTIPARGKDSTP